MNRFTFWQRWLLGVSAFVVAFGMYMALFSGTALFSVFNNNFDPVFWGQQDVPERAWRFQRWIYGVLGSTMAGWGVLLTAVVAGPFKRREAWAWWGLVAALGLWYAVDTGISLYYGAVFNGAFNTLFLIALALPLAATRRQFA